MKKIIVLAAFIVFSVAFAFYEIALCTNEPAKRDGNRVPTELGVSDTSGETRNIHTDEDGYLYTHATGTATISGTVTCSGISAASTTVFLKQESTGRALTIGAGTGGLSAFSFIHSKLMRSDGTGYYEDTNGILSVLPGQYYYTTGRTIPTYDLTNFGTSQVAATMTLTADWTYASVTLPFDTSAAAWAYTGIIVTLESDPTGVASDTVPISFYVSGSAWARNVVTESCNIMESCNIKFPHPIYLSVAAGATELVVYARMSSRAGGSLGVRVEMKGWR